ncbi:MAG: hypothetical protein ABR875_03345 [Minisyncoccia bacterium]|jgi:hypothetical protein
MKIWEFWPFTLLPVVYFFNIYIIAVIMLKRHSTDVGIIFLGACLLGSLDLIYHYWLCGRLGKIIKRIKSINEEVKLTEDAVPWIVQGLLKKHNLVTNGNHRAVNWIKRDGLIALFIIGLNPIPIFRTLIVIFALIFCRLIDWRIGFCSLLVGNIFHFGIIVVFWKPFSHMLHL